MSIYHARSIAHHAYTTPGAWRSPTLDRRAMELMERKVIVANFCRAFDSDTAHGIDSILMGYL